MFYPIEKNIFLSKIVSERCLSCLFVYFAQKFLLTVHNCVYHFLAFNKVSSHNPDLCTVLSDLCVLSELGICRP